MNILSYEMWGSQADSYTPQLKYLQSLKVCANNSGTESHIYHESKERNFVTGVQKLLWFHALYQNTIYK
jgi:hypothetical protein